MIISHSLESWVRILVFSATFNNISWQLVLLVEETGVLAKNHRPVASHWQTLSHCIEYTSAWTGFELTTLVVIGTDCICSYKSNYYAITTTTASCHGLECEIEQYLPNTHHVHLSMRNQACRVFNERLREFEYWIISSLIIEFELIISGKLFVFTNILVQQVQLCNYKKIIYLQFCSDSNTFS